MANNNRQCKRKTFDFSHRKLVEMPLIKEKDYFDLFLDNNSLSHIDTIPSSCLKLSVSNNKISSINSTIHTSLRLIFLDLSSNRLISLVGIENLVTVSFLNLSNNYISDEQLSYLFPLKNLKHLNMSNNNLKNGTIAKTISDLKSLERINLNINHIESLTFCDSNSTLIQLDIDSNKLLFLCFNKNTLNSLTYLSINNNKLTSIPTLVNLPELAYLSIEENSIQSIFLHMLIRLKCIKLSNNGIQKYSDLNSSAEIIELSYNNLSDFYLSNTNNHLKSLVLNNNKLEQIGIDENDNVNKTIEFVELSNNSFKEISVLKFFPKLIRVNLSFNQLSNVNDLVSILKELHFLRELNLIENIFNRGVYDPDLFSFTFNSINDYYNNAIGRNSNKPSLEEYRSYILVNLNQITFLDIIAITQAERDTGFTMKEKSNHTKKPSNNQTMRYLLNQQENTRIAKPQIPQKHMSTHESGNSKASKQQQEIKNEIMNKLFDMFQNFEDNNGYIYYKQLVDIFKELNELYEVTKYTSNVLIDIKNTIKSSLIPYKIHIKDLATILKQKQYEEMYIQIKSNIKQSKTIDTKAQTNCSNKNTTFTTLNKEEIEMTANKSKIKSKVNEIPKKEKKIMSGTATPVKSPFLSSHRSSQQNTQMNQITQINIPLNHKNKVFNILFQSNTELTPNLSNKEFLVNFLFFINHINIIIRYKDTLNSYLLQISKEEKEYKFLKTFLSNYDITQSFKLKKWYNYKYYTQVFLNWNSFDYLFENIPLFFFSHYNEIIDNFVNNKYSSFKDCYLMIEENPLNLLSKGESKEIVMLVNIQKNGDPSHNKPTNLVYNEDDEQFYYKNPFEFTGSSPCSLINNNCILVPVYIITFNE